MAANDKFPQIEKYDNYIRLVLDYIIVMDIYEKPSESISAQIHKLLYEKKEITAIKYEVAYIVYQHLLLDGEQFVYRQKRHIRSNGVETSMYSMGHTITNPHFISELEQILNEDDNLCFIKGCFSL